MGDRFLQSGSAPLFFLIKILNVAFGISALGLVALAIWLWKQFNAFTIADIAFIALGIFQVFLVCLIFTAQKSVIKLRCYLFFTMALFLAQLTAVVVVFATGDRIISDIAKDSQKQIDELKKYLNIVTYYCAGTLALMAVQMTLTYCYIGSLRDRNDQFDYKFVDEDGNKISLQKKIESDQNVVSDRYSKKREEMMNKYESYRNYKQQGK